MAEEKRRRRWPRWLVGVLAALALVWCGLWYAAYWAASSAIDRVTATRRVNCGERSFSGFPLRLDFRCDRGAVGGGENEGVIAALSGIEASAPLYWPGYIEAAVTGPLVINAPASDLALTASWSKAAINAEAGVAGLKRFGASFASFKLDSTGAGDAMALRGLTARAASIAIAPGRERAYRLALSATGLGIKTATRDLPELDGDLELAALDFGRTLGMDPAVAVLGWLAAGGTLQIDRLRFASGGASVGATGQVSLSPAGLVSGNITLQLGGVERLSEVAEAFQPGMRERLDQVVAVISTLPAGDSPDGPVRKLPLQIRDGRVAFGLIPLGTIPPIRF